MLNGRSASAKRFKIIDFHTEKITFLLSIKLPGYRGQEFMGGQRFAVIGYFYIKSIKY